MNIIIWIFFGLCSGIVVNSLDPKPAYGGILGAIFLGVTGAFMAGMISSILLNGGFTGVNIATVIIAVIGSMTFLLLGKSIRRT